MPHRAPTFEFRLMTRSRTLVDCRVSMLIVPAHDGQLGLMRNHSPIITRLGLGIMYAKGVTDHDFNPLPDSFYLIDDGIARMSDNRATVLAYDVTGLEGLEMDRVEEMLEEANKLLAGDAFTTQARQHLIKKASLIKQLAELADLPRETQQASKTE
jgi:F-type H+-transporting ATPase subunit epsilon